MWAFIQLQMKLNIVSIAGNEVEPEPKMNLKVIYSIANVISYANFAPYTRRVAPKLLSKRIWKACTIWKHKRKGGNRGIF